MPMKFTISPQLLEQLSALWDSTLPPVSNLSNASALLMETVSHLNWAGFYLSRGDVLYLGPFQGKPACTVIPYGKGVCGTAAQQKSTQRVEDVHQFPGHIACDSASNAELVVPLIGADGRVLGVLDLDSTSLGRFSPEDQEILEQAGAMIARQLPEDFSI